MNDEETSMSEGFTPPGKPDKPLKKMPNDISYLPFRTTTGMWSDYVHAHNPNDVVNYLQSLDYGSHVDNVYDCEDRAFWGIAHARSRFPGQPMAAAIGKAVGGPFDGQNHAVIAFWAKDRNIYKNFYFDPEVKVSGSAKVKGDLVNFDTKILVPFPMWRKNSKSGKQEELPPFNKGFSYQSGAAVLDRSYTLFNADSHNKMMDFLEKKSYGMPKGPSDPDLSSLFDTHWMKIVEDRVLWVFVHARRKFKGYATGMAFGSMARDNADYALLVIWNDKGEPLLYDIETGLIKSSDFKARTVIV